MSLNIAQGQPTTNQTGAPSKGDGKCKGHDESAKPRTANEQTLKPTVNRGMNPYNA